MKFIPLVVLNSTVHTVKPRPAVLLRQLRYREQSWHVKKLLKDCSSNSTENSAKLPRSLNAVGTFYYDRRAVDCCATSFCTPCYTVLWQALPFSLARLRTILEYGMLLSYLLSADKCKLREDNT